MVPGPDAEMVPHAASEQLAPDTLQLIVGEGFDPGIGMSTAENTFADETDTDVGPLSASAKRLMIVIAVDALLDGSAALVAVSNTEGGEGRMTGAVNTPAVLTPPHELPTHPAPLSDQLTAVLGFPADAMAAPNTCSAPSSTPALGGVIATATSLVIVMVADADLVRSAALVAVTVTAGGMGRTFGAVKTPPEIVPTALFPLGMPDTLQVTATFDAFETAAVSATESPSNTDALGGVSDTETGCVLVCCAERPAEVRPHPVASAAAISASSVIVPLAVAFVSARLRRVLSTPNRVSTTTATFALSRFTAWIE